MCFHRKDAKKANMHLTTKLHIYSLDISPLILETSAFTVAAHPKQGRDQNSSKEDVPLATKLPYEVRQ